ncbi:MAG TPA: hypothetical protein VHI54_06910 [Actinomycetota bacterium]|nr:hypothetical protein [Actinomycetota bacterium]
MNEGDETRNHANHPEELLAAYVSGEASEGDRTNIQALLSVCSECRREVDVAVQARAALQSLPGLEAPGLRLDGVVRPADSASRQREPGSRPGFLDRVRGWGWERIAWGAGLVAAGSLVALFFLVQLSGDLGQQPAAPAPQRGAESDGTFNKTAGGSNYTPASLDALAKRLAGSERTALATPQTTPAPASAPKATLEPLSGGSDRARECLRRGGGLQPRTRPVYLEEATFRGIAAYVGAFESAARGGRRYLLVLAVNRSTCDALYVINRSL